ncbi:2OG-Fe(II) oxygenase [Nocardia colli]|uniref:2OG-Fe(II) oxygenase n=1 Tax=Nocardia colli TaxID=2545717 RepID=A0A5N0ENL5_9NOCA|nr:2OG-Fe(II) oxygenase family protein [Nocardia colli]KAA8890466.1 2OG-Fe(II) oxygenase [Nocardia colli]
MTTESVLEAQARPERFADLFAHRRWIRRSQPFPHVYARDVFVPEYYQRMTDDLARVQRDRPELFGQVATNYSAVGVRLADVADTALSVFTSREWHDLITGVAGVTGTGDIEGSVHHHAPGAPYGWPHNDLNPAWFPGDPPGPGEVRLPDGTVDTKTGARADGVVARESIRAVAVLFYFGNPGWQPGDGGETALYDNIAEGEKLPDLTLVPPLDNSLIMFEVTPRTWHTFAGGNTKDRNSVVMWAHRTKDEALERWGGDRIVYW